MTKGCKKRTVLFFFLSGAFFCALLAGYGFFIEPGDIELRHVRIQDARLAGLLGDKVVVQISDLHIGPVVGRREERVLGMLAAVQPDIIFLTGDYVAWQGEYAGAIDFLSRLRARIGIWGVLGDYDYSRSRQSCLFCHESGSGKPTKSHETHFLSDRAIDVPINGEMLRIVGISAEDDRFPNIVPFLQQSSLPTIVLSHNPLAFDLVPEDQGILMLAGDTHGGQAALPGWVFDLLGYRKNARYNEGLFRHGKNTMFVSRGIGMSHVPVRLFRRPEIVVLHFSDAQNE